MAINQPINVPQVQSQGPQFPAGAVSSLVEGYLNRPTQAQFGAQQIQEGLGTLVKGQQYNQARKIEGIKALSDLYGNGGEWLAQKFGPQLSQATGVAMTPDQQDPSAQPTQQPTSQLHPADPYGTIRASVDAGYHDHSGLYSPGQPGLGGLQGFKDYVSSHPGVGGKMLTNQMGIAKGMGEMEVNASKFATPEQGAAIYSGDPDAVAKAYGGNAPVEAYTGAKQSSQFETNKRNELNAKKEAIEKDFQGKNEAVNSALDAIQSSLLLKSKAAKEAGPIAGRVATKTQGFKGKGPTYELNRNNEFQRSKLQHVQEVNRFNPEEVQFIGGGSLAQPIEDMNTSISKGQNAVDAFNRQLQRNQIAKNAQLRALGLPEDNSPIPKIDLRKWLESNTKTVPKVGEVYKDHIFLGGDPSNQASWRKQ